MAGTPRGSTASASLLAEAGVGLSQELLEATLELLPFAAILVEPGTGQVLFANRAADRLAGGMFPRAADASVYADLYAWTTPDGQPLSADRHPAVRAARGERIDGCQLDWHLPNGTRSLLASGAIVPATTNRGALALVVFDDVTAIRRAEAEAREAQALLDTFFESAPLGLAFFDRDLRYQRVNAALAVLNGVPADAHLGRTVLDVLPDQNPEVVDLLARVLETGEAIEGEVSGYTPAAPAERRHWIVAFYPAFSATGEVLGVGATVTDITARVAAEQRAAFLARAGEVLGRSLDFETTLRDVAAIAVPDIADWCVIDLLESDGTIRRVAVAHEDPDKVRLGWDLSARYPPHVEEPGALSAVLRAGAAIETREIDDAMLRAIARDEEHLEILRELGFTGGLSAPLIVRARVIGAIHFLFTDARRRPGQVDPELATQLAGQAATAIDNARLYRDRSRIAQTLQRSLLPPRLPRIEGFEIAARYRAAGQGNDVGGDFYDVFQRTDSSWVVVLGDVCGKGPEAAALTALARYTLRAAAITTGAPAALLGALNEAILRDQPGDGPAYRFMTAVTGCLDLDPEAPALTIGAGGHPPPVLVRADGTGEALDVAGTALGLLPGVEIGSRRVSLEPGDALLLYTDGVLDAGAPRRPLTVGELVTAAAGAAGAPAARMAEAVERAALERTVGAPRDDIAIVVLRREPLG